MLIHTNGWVLPFGVFRVVCVRLVGISVGAALRVLGVGAVLCAVGGGLGVGQLALAQGAPGAKAASPAANPTAKSAATPAKAQVTLAEAAQMMALTAPDFRIIDLDLLNASERVKQAKGQRRPQVSLETDYTYTNQNIISQDNSTFEKGQSTYPVAKFTLSLVQPIYDAVKFRALPAAQAEEAVAKAQAISDRIDLNRQLVGAFVKVATAQNRVTQAKAVLAARTEFSKDIDELVAQGRAEADRQWQAQGDILSAQSAVAEAEADVGDALFDLRRLIGVGVAGVRVTGGFALASRRSLGQTFSPDSLETMNPQIQIAKGQLDLAQRQVRLAKGRFLPTANLVLENKYNKSEGSLFGGGSEVASTDIGLQFTWSIYEGGVRKSQVRVANNEVQAAELRLTQARDQATARLAALNEALDGAQKILSSAAEQQRIASSRYDAVQTQLAAGKGSRQNLLEAGLRRDLAAIDGQSARLRVMQIQAEIFALFGALDTDALSRNLSGG